MCVQPIHFARAKNRTPERERSENWLLPLLLLLPRTTNILRTARRRAKSRSVARLLRPGLAVVFRTPAQRERVTRGIFVCSGAMVHARTHSRARFSRTRARTHSFTHMQARRGATRSSKQAIECLLAASLACLLVRSLARSLPAAGKHVGRQGSD